MDNFGYRNWDDNDESNDSSSHFNYNAPSTLSSKKNSKSNNNSDMYDFDISDDFGSSPNISNSRQNRQSYKTSDSREDMYGSNTSRFGGNNVRRSSVEDRAKEILQRNQALKVSKDDKKTEIETDTFSSFEAGYKALLEGIDISAKEPPSPPVASDTDELSPLKSLQSYNVGRGKFKSSRQSYTSAPNTDSPMSQSSTSADSFEISAADLEVAVELTIIFLMTRLCWC